MDLSVNIAIAINSIQIATLLTDFGITGRILNSQYHSKATVFDVILRMIVAVLIVFSMMLWVHDIDIKFLILSPPLFIAIVSRDYFISNGMVKCTLNEGYFYLAILLAFLLSRSMGLFFTIMIISSVLAVYVTIKNLYDSNVLSKSRKKLFCDLYKDDYFISLNRILGGLTTVFDVTLISYFVSNKHDLSTYLAYKIIVNIFAALSSAFILKYVRNINFKNYSRIANSICRIVFAISVIFILIFLYIGGLVKYGESIVIVCFICSGFCVFSYSIQHPLIMKNRGNDKLFKIAFITNILAVLIYISLIPVLGIVGAAIGFAMQNILVQYLTNKIYNAAELL